MLQLVQNPTVQLSAYDNLVSKELLEEIEQISSSLKGLRVFHVNATPRGGGVAEILKSMVPLMNDVGLKADWYTIPPSSSFFDVTKKMHNALQGGDYKFPFEDRKEYMFHMAKTAELMRDMKPDIWLIHDPQPAGVVQFLPNFYPAISHIHIDLTSPNREVWEFMTGFLECYDKVVLSSEDFIKKEIKEKVVIFSPALNVLNFKNNPLPLKEAKEILRNFDINPEKPLMTQVSRFDPWKDPLGVIDAYYLARKKIPDLQLAMVGLIEAKDDPEAKLVYEKVKEKAANDPNIFLFADPGRLGNLEVDVFVNAMQVASDVILQKSIREGFGMTVCEAMWKQKPVIGGNVGGIKLQIKDGLNGFLISSSSEAAERTVQLIQNPLLAQKMGQEAKKSVGENFLMLRLLRDYLKLFKEII
ncbi:MAG: glycosyltransferase [Candidatus Nealsonbacteria bacterium]